MARELKLDLVERSPEGTLTFKLEGSLGVEGSTGVQGLLKACISEKLFSLILDLEDVNFISSAGMGAFLSIVGELRENDGDIVFVKMQDRIREIFSSLDVLDYFVVVDSIKDAKEYFAKRGREGGKTGKTEESAEDTEAGKVDPKMTILSLVSGYTDIIETTSTFDDKIEKLLTVTATFLRVDPVTLFVVDTESSFPSFNTETRVPELKTGVKKAINAAIIGGAIIDIDDIKTSDPELLNWLGIANTKKILPIYYRGALHSIVLVSGRDEDFNASEMRALRLLRGILSLLIESWTIEYEASKSPDKENVRQVRRRLEQKLIEMETLYMVSEQLATTVDLEKLTPTLLVVLVGQMSTDKAALFLEGAHGEFEVFTSKGIDERQLMNLKLNEGKGLLKELANGKAPVMLDIIGVLAQGEIKKEVDRLMDLGISLVAPMFFKDTLIGIVGVGKKVSERDYTADELKLLSALVNLSSVSVETARLFTRMKETYSGVVKSLVSAIEAKDPFTRGHTERVTRYASVFGKYLGLNEDQIQVLMFGAVLHDVGYIGISEEIIRKPDGLTPEEREALEKHPEIGVAIIRKLPFMEESVDIVKYHHERYDGTGYPEGLKGEAIPVNARIISICDAFDAMTSERRYRPAKSIEEAIIELKHASGTQFDPELMKIFLTLIDNGSLKVIKSGK